MHTIQSAIPGSRLRPFVRCFAQREISAHGSSLVEAALASLEHILAFKLSGESILDDGSRTGAVPRISFSGTSTRFPGYLSFTGSVLAFGIFLKPFACWQLFHIPPAEFADHQFEAEEVFGTWICDLWFKLAECKNFCDRVRVATETLLPFAEHAIPLTRTMAAAQNFFRADFGMRIQQLVSCPGDSVSKGVHFRRRSPPQTHEVHPGIHNLRPAYSLDLYRSQTPYPR